LTLRADDYEESVSTRLKTYEEKTAPLINYYEKTGRLKKVSGEGSLEEIYLKIDELI
jgi:adenylate kinase